MKVVNSYSWQSLQINHITLLGCLLVLISLRVYFTIMGYHLLSNSWFILGKIFKYMGINACTKDEFGSIQPVSARSYWCRLMITLVLLLVLLGITLLHSVFFEIQTVKYILPGHVMLTDIIATLTITFCILVKFFAFIYKLRQIMKGR